MNKATIFSCTSKGTKIIKFNNPDGSLSEMRIGYSKDDTVNITETTTKVYQMTKDGLIEYLGTVINLEQQFPDDCSFE